MADDIIAAIATPPGRGSVGIVRISGPHLESLFEKLTGRRVTPRRAAVMDFYAEDGSPIDRGLALFFPAPHSYTGEDVIELQGHGGTVVMQLLLRRCCDLGARVAEPGEFTKRAFLNDKIDLAQAEGIADLIDAATTEAARSAMRSLQGQFSRAIEALVSSLIELRARIEAVLDFPEEDDIVMPLQAKIERDLESLRARLDAVFDASRQGSLLREGVRVVLAGHPNVGKSSLLNRLAGENLAIVTPLPGTTRDAIRQVIDIDGVPLRIVDTAGLRDPRDEIENIGISISWDEISKADVVLWISDITRPETQTQAFATQNWQSIKAKQIHVENKIDLISGAPALRETNGIFEISLSATTGSGVDLLRTAILETIGWNSHGESTYMARARHLEALRHAKTHLARAIAQSGQLELLAEELRLTQNTLASIVGEFTPDDLLGEIFARFCIGK